MTGKDKGHWWRCNTCGKDAPEHTVECGDEFVDIVNEERYKLVWVSRNPTVSVEEFNNLSDLNTFMNNQLREEEYPLHVIRKSDFKSVEVKDVPKEQRSTDNKYQIKF